MRAAIAWHPEFPFPHRRTGELLKF